MTRGSVLAGAMVSTMALAPPGLGAETILSGLDYPWDIESHAGEIFVTEKAGFLGVLDGQTFLRLPVDTSVPILDDRGGGLLGLALRPDFSETGRAVIYHQFGMPEDRQNRVVEIERQDDRWVETRVLVDEIPGHPLYNGGRVAFGPDGMLYVTTGWTENRDHPQDMNNLAGKILRVTPDGAVPDDNPTPDSLVFSLGHRNPQGIAWDGEGRMFAAEHGQSGHDEVNLVEPGANYGWPIIQGEEFADGMRGPIAHSGMSTWAPSGLAYDGNRLLLAGLRAGAVLAVGPDGEVSEEFPVGERIRDVMVVDGTILAITSNRSPRQNGTSRDRLIRLFP